MVARLAQFPSVRPRARSCCRPRSDAPTGAAALRVLTSRADELSPDERARRPDPLSARDDPEGARRTVARVLHAALELAAEPWTPGAAVPFEQEQLELLARVAQGELHGAARRDALDSLLAR